MAGAGAYDHNHKPGFGDRSCTAHNRRIRVDDCEGSIRAETSPGRCLKGEAVCLSVDQIELKRHLLVDRVSRRESSATKKLESKTPSLFVQTAL